MAPPNEEQLFETFRSSGDPAALAEVFDRTAKDLLRLAIHLSGELAAAEDLVQDTYLAAIEAAASYRSGRPLRGWLVKIMQNRARRLRRRRRKTEPLSESAWAGPTEPAAVELASQRELQQLLQKAVASLTEPYRTVVGLHARHGFTVNEIAESLQRSAHTVRSQLARGLERLEQRLPAQAVMGTAVVPAFAGIRAAVVAQAASQGPGLAAGLGKTKVGALAAVLLILGVSIVVWNGGGVGSTGIPVSEGGADRSAARPHQTPVVQAPDRRPVRAAPVTSRFADPIRLRVVDRSTGLPVPGAEVRTWGEAGFRQMDLSPGEYYRDYSYYHAHDQEALLRRYGVSTVSGADGTFVITARQDGVITARHGKRFGQGVEGDTIFLDVDETFEVDLRDAAGRPVSGVRVALSAAKPFPALSYRRFSSMARTDAEGRAVIPHIQLLRSHLQLSGEQTVGLHAVVPGAQRGARRLSVRTLGQAPVQLSLAPSRSIRVRVRDPFGRQLKPTHGDRDPHLSIANPRWALEPRADEWAVDHLPLGQAVDLDLSWGGFSLHRVSIPLRQAGEPVQVQIDLGDRAGYATLVGRAVDIDGQPIDAAALVCSLGGVGELVSEIAADGRFFCFYPNAEPDLPEHFDLQVVDIRYHRVGWEDRRRARNLAARVRITDPRPGILQLGDVVLRAAPELGRGHLSASAMARAEVLRAAPWKVQERATTGWRDVAAGHLAWREGGSFVVSGATSATQLRFYLCPSGGTDTVLRAAVECRFRRGQDDLVLAYTEVGRIVLDLLCDQLAAELSFQLEPLAGGEAVTVRRPAASADPIGSETGSGSFGLRPPGRHLVVNLGLVDPGSYRVTIRQARSKTVLHSTTAVAVLPGRQVRPWRETPIDLRN